MIKTVKSRRSTPRRSTPKRSTSRRSTPRRSTPRRSTPRRSTPRRSSPRRNTSRRSRSQRKTSRRVYRLKATPVRINIAEQKKLRTRKWKNVNSTWVSASDVEQPKTSNRNSRAKSPTLRELKNMRTRKWPPVQVKSVIPWNETRK